MLFYKRSISDGFVSFFLGAFVLQSYVRLSGAARVKKRGGSKMTFNFMTSRTGNPQAGPQSRAVCIRLKLAEAKLASRKQKALMMVCFG